MSYFARHMRQAALAQVALQHESSDKCQKLIFTRDIRGLRKIMKEFQYGPEESHYKSRRENR